MRLGNAIASMATPIAIGLGLPCIDPAINQLRPESGCARRRNALNDFSDMIYDRFWPGNNNGKGDIKMEFIVTKQISVEANTVEEAVAKNAEGKTISISATLRPQPIVRPPMVGQTVVRP